jgi:hypothetical protein
MRSEAEIRREIESRLRRRGLLIVHGAIWAAVTTSLYLYARVQGVPVGWTNSAVFFMSLWAFIVGLHAFYVIYVELRERLVRKAIERERKYYQMGDAYYGKRKRFEALPPLEDDEDDSEDALVDFPEEVRRKRER